MGLIIINPLFYNIVIYFSYYCKSIIFTMAKISIVLGALFGDEGKGSFVNYLATKSHKPLIVRFSGGHQVGHCQTKDTIITTKYGLKYLGEIVGNETNSHKSYELINSDLNIENTSLLYKESNVLINKIILNNGVILKCTSKHKYLVWNGENMKKEWVESDNLDLNIHQFIFPKKYDNYCGNDKFDLRFINIDTDYIHNKFKFNIKKLDYEFIGFFIGLVNGDGMFTKKSVRLIFNKKQSDVIEIIKNEFKKMNYKISIANHPTTKECLNVEIFSTDLLNILLELGVYFGKCYDKKTPKFVMNGNKKIIKSYLQGLFDPENN